MTTLDYNFQNKHNRKRKGKAHHSINDSLGDPLSCSTFDESFKYYKRRCPPPDLSQLLDVNSTTKLETYKIQEIMPVSLEESKTKDLGLSPTSMWRLLKFCDKPGLLYIPNPFTVEGQQKWIKHSIEDYTKKPYKLNLSAHPNLQIHLQSQDWWDACCKNYAYSAVLRKKLRWSTLGYHHNWDTKIYSDNDRCEFPSELGDLSSVIAQAAGFSEFKAEAAIVNFYHTDSTLAGHTDHSEQDHTAPLLSISFGQSAIFLIGGQERSEHALALLVQSGDIVIMSAASRLSYHGVPRIISGSSSDSWKSELLPDTYKDYLSDSRINLNVRQVLKPGRSLINN